MAKEDLVNKEEKFNASDFELVQESSKISDAKFESKPTTFFKDSLKRFSKNKSSIVGAFILGILVILAIFLPVFSTYDIDTVSKQEAFLAPKLFESGTGWWDGTKKYERIVYDTENEAPAGFYKPAVVKCTVDSEPTLINQANEYGKGGYVMFVHENDTTSSRTLSSYSADFTSNGNYVVTVNLNDVDGVNEGKLGEYRVLFSVNASETNEAQQLVLKDWTNNHDDFTLNISSALASAGLNDVNGSLVFELKNEPGIYTYMLLESVVFTGNNTETMETISFTDATKMVLLAKTPEGTPEGYWSCTGRKGIYQSVIYYCDFVFDTYAKAYDSQIVVYAYSDFKKLEDQGYCKLEYERGNAESFTFTILDEENCPIDGVDSITLSSVTGKLNSVNAEVFRYKKMGYDKMPKFLFGTDASGHDIVKKAFSGLRTSLFLGVCTALFCFVFGLIWGSISGYFGGNVDLIMERFCDILGGVPWIVVMTLCILHLGNNLFTFFIALCATGWMGTAARTRTQFYRFKGREYVLASRTLGSSDTRLIFKHILPNSLGTIITSSVFMITSVIGSEASLAYLNLGLQGQHSFGVMLAENQQYISSNPNLIVFPAVIMSLMMISFNLFGNGLRDAVNPSLKGSD